MGHTIQRLSEIAPEIAQVLMPGGSVALRIPAVQIKRETVWVAMRDGIRLATDVYFPPNCPAPTVAVRTPYGRSLIDQELLSFAQQGYVVIAQDCRGTGESEPERWETYVFEREDGVDFVEWITKQPWFDGFIGSCGGSYLGSTQWSMAMHPRMSAIAPEVAGLVIFPTDMPRYHMLVNAYSRSMGKGANKVAMSFWDLERQMIGETLASGYFNEPLYMPLRQELADRFPALSSLSPFEAQRWLWGEYRKQPPAERADFIKLALGSGAVTLASLDQMTAVFGHRVPVGLYINPSADTAELAASLHAPALVITGWYDWGLGDTLATWSLLQAAAAPQVKTQSRLLITPSAHNMPGYREGREGHPELDLTYRAVSVSVEPERAGNIHDLLLKWWSAVREQSLDAWPVAIYYLMGANEWRAASAWPPPEAEPYTLYLGAEGGLSPMAPGRRSEPDQFIYDPDDPTPTLGGSLISAVYLPGSVDVSSVQQRSDVLVYSTAPLTEDVDVVGPLRLILYASSSAVDTDWVARLSDVFPDGRAIQLQNGALRARYRQAQGAAELLEPARVYRFEVDLWATANRFKAGHRIRLDISSADFPRLERNANLGGNLGPPIKATQAVFHDAERPSHLLLSIVGNVGAPSCPTY